MQLLLLAGNATRPAIVKFFFFDIRAYSLEVCKKYKDTS